MKLLALLALMFSLTGCAVLGFKHNPKYPTFNDDCKPEEIQKISYEYAKWHYRYQDYLLTGKNPLFCADYSDDQEFQKEYITLMKPFTSLFIGYSFGAWFPITGAPFWITP